MATRDSNRYGKIVISKRAIRSVVNGVLKESYGIASGCVVSISTEFNKIRLAINLKLKFGVTITAITESIRETIRYSVENFTGMKVEEINLRVAGIG